MAEHSFPCGDSEIHLTISAGVDAVDSGAIADPKVAIEEIFHRLNGALYSAKKTGGNRVEAVKSAAS